MYLEDSQIALAQDGWVIEQHLPCRRGERGVADELLDVAPFAVEEQDAVVPAVGDIDVAVLVDCDARRRFSCPSPSPLDPIVMSGSPAGLNFCTRSLRQSPT